MKRIFCLLLAVIISAGVTGCAETPANAGAAPQSPVSETTAAGTDDSEGVVPVESIEIVVGDDEEGTAVVETAGATATTEAITTATTTTAPPTMTAPEKTIKSGVFYCAGEELSKAEWWDTMLEASKNQLDRFALFGYRIDEEGNIMVNTADWTPATEEQYKEYFLGEYKECYSLSLFTIDEIPENASVHMAGNNAIICVTFFDDLDSFWYVSWIDFSKPDEIITYGAYELFENEIRFHSIFANYEATVIGGYAKRVIPDGTYETS